MYTLTDKAGGPASPSDELTKRALPAAAEPAVSSAEAALGKLHGGKLAKDIARGVRFCAYVWDWANSDAERFVAFCTKHYCPPGKARRSLLRRLDEVTHTVEGLFNVMMKVNKAGLDIADQPLTPADELFGAFTAATHANEDLRTFGVAALAQLNFGTDDLAPPTTREAWAARRLSKVGRTAVPAALSAEASMRSAEVDQFVSSFTLHLDKITYTDPAVAFPPKTARGSHWGLRDYMTSLSGQKDALPRQRAIRDLLRRVVDGELPREILGRPDVSWNQADGTITEKGATRPGTPTGALRWEKFKAVYDVQRRIDPYRTFRSLIADKFNLDREIPEQRIVGILEDLLSSPVMAQVGTYLAGKLGRPLEAHDIYFRSGFQSGVKKAPLPYELGKRYPDAAALTAAIPGILVKLGFPAARARWIGARIRVDNSRSAGHAWPPGTKQDLALLRVQIGKGGINEQNFETFMHELGHSTEQVLTSHEMDYKALWGVPNTAFTEAFAFTFQDQTDRILGRKVKVDADVATLQRLWEVYQSAGPSLVEIRFFHWLYDHPEATAEAMHREVRRIADEVWAKYYARVLGTEGFGLMGVYSHMLWCWFYLADYTMGYVIAYQVRKFLSTRKFAPEMERVCALGSIYPESWMKAAVGQSISARPLLRDGAAAAARVLARK